MNILIPHTWLLEYLDTEATPQEIQKYLSLSGPSVERIYDKEGEPVYDIEITTNRVDCLSVKGIAKEAYVILNQAGIKTNLKNKSLQLIEVKKDLLPYPEVKIETKTCRRTAGILLQNVQRTATPEWMAKRLKQIDQQVHDSVIDITNYITHELGYPCHAFDYDQVMRHGGITIIEAKPGQKFTTLDNQSYTTVGGEIVFVGKAGEIIDLPAVMGTANTSVNSQTKNILLWIESLSPEKVRFTSMTHAIRTQAALLSEKDVDPSLAIDVLKLGVQLYKQLCQATVASALHDHYPQPYQSQPINLPINTIDQYLGLELPVKTITGILEKLDCQVEVTTNKKSSTQAQRAEQLQVIPPVYRHDLTIPADVVEEIARIYGYHNLPSQIMATAIPLTKPVGLNLTLESKIKHFLANIGWQEVYTYSMVSDQLAQKSGYKLNEHLKLLNPLTEDKVYLRRSLLPSLIEAIEQNPRHQLSVFEIANVYHPRNKNLPDEQLHLCLVSNRDLRAIKGDLEALLGRFYLNDVTYQQQANENSAKILIQQAGKSVTLGIIAVNNQYILIDIPMANLLAVAQSHPAYQPIPRTSLIKEELTFKIPESVQIGEVVTSLKQADPYIYQVAYKDAYQQNHTFELSYLNPDQNLTSQDVEPIRKKIVKLVQDQYQAQLIGELK